VLWIWAFIVRTVNLLQTQWSLRNESVDVEESVNTYNKLHKDATEVERQEHYKRLVLNYYNLSTVFYEWGWGPAFHFAIWKPHETFEQSILRHQLELVEKLNMGPGVKVLDVGCGIGGPTRNLAKATKATITGLNINSYQIERARKETAAVGLSKSVDYVVGDFCKMPFPDSSFDAVYAVEATCHAPKREDVFGEAFRVLKPGGRFSSYEWCLTPKHDPSNPRHMAIKKQIEIGCGLPTTITFETCLDALKAVGFEVIEWRDAFQDDKTWYTPLEGHYTKPSTFQFTPWGRWLLLKTLALMEGRVAPRGTVKVSDVLFTGSLGLTAAGREGIYTPGLYSLAQKPKKIN